MAQTKVIAIAAIGKNRGLGKKNQLLYKIPEDMRHFRDATMGHPIITGRKNFESMGVLSGRKNIVVTRDTTYQPKECIVTHTIEDAIAKAKELDTEKIFIVGGGEIYKAALPYTDQLDLTLIDEEKDADVFFPEYPEFKKIISEEKHESDEVSYTFTILER